MGGLTSLPTAKIYVQAYQQMVMSTTTHPPKVWKQVIDYVLCMYLAHTLHQINKLYQNIKLLLRKKITKKLAFLDTLLKHNNGKILVLAYRK